ncbi:hypothetical protein HY484_02870 [Candidatus Woesearchaeota archaeon]|nr:hypothetical protein [Candidatus Woesearchaeota archaeon]
MSLLNKIKTAAATVAVASVGCSSTEKKEYPTWMLPVNAAAGYFGAVATHEAGHALAAKLGGAKKIKVDVLPGNYNNDGFHLGYTESNGTSLSKSEYTWFNVAGPLANFGEGIIVRETLKTGYVPNIVQPTLQWVALWNKCFGYSEAINGLVRRKNTDFGKENIGIPLGFIAAQMAYDIYDFGSDQRFMDVLTGEKFYEPKKTEVSLETTTDGIGLFVTKRF